MTELGYICTKSKVPANSQFGTRFEEMDAISGRTQTTKGIWLANSKKLSQPKSFIIDLEGSDGRERGEDDSSFERQSSLFALAIADILVVNMWAKDVGREAGAGKPLLKTIFQVGIHMILSSPLPSSRVYSALTSLGYTSAFSKKAFPFMSPHAAKI